MLPKACLYSKTSAFLVLALALALYPQASLAATAALSAPLVPVQSSSVAATGIQQGSYQTIEVKEVKGEVSVKRLGSDQFETVQNGGMLHAGDFVKTGEGSCRLSIDGKDDLTLAPRTLMKINEASRNDRNKTSSTELNIESGKLKVTLAKLKKGSTFQVTTPTAVTAVRGTIFYLNAGFFLGQNATQIYVDKSRGGVVFKNTTTGRSFIIPAFSTSNSFADGKLNEPRELTPEQREIFVQNWENPSSASAAQQFDIEEIPNPNAGSSDDEEGLPDENAGPKTNDAAQDRISEQNIAGSNGLPAPDAPAGPSLDDQEKNMLRLEIARIRADQDFDHADANLAQVSDAQTGKVFTDVFGNRVRVDQYIFHEANSDTVQFLSLTARTGAYQNGVSSVLFGTQFNRGIGSDVDLKSLPWNDYMNVVKQEDVAANLGIPEQIPAPGGIGTVNNPVYDALFEEYIIHEHAPGLTLGPSALYPVHFFAEFTNPVGDRAGSDLVRFDDFYSTTPFSIDLKVGQVLQPFVAQRKEADSMLIQPFQGEKVKVVFDHLTDLKTITIGQGAPQPFIDNQQDGDGGSQTSAFAANFDPSKLLDINFYRNLPVNEDGDPNNDEHPAYFDDRLNERLDVNNVLIGYSHLIGGFVPIDDQGRIIDQPGFRVRGLRDLLSPNPQVNGGNYNLEVIFLYGYVDGQDSLPTDLFHEEFRIDTIITPGIFQDFSSTLNNSLLFPSVLRADDDDTP